ncbi:hypothetical protein BaRGS_00029732 [Batillaria attramentaria]|uniref:C1q domain-containing protein n=1 Tax=Batillaria attramentaria TaxID=370345 RepID=A0ABD0JVG3_9CAEN
MLFTFIPPATEEHRVSFHAKLSSPASLSSGQILIPDHIITNQGNAYNAATGYFTATYNGTYVFLATTGPSQSSSYHADLDLMANNEVMSSIRTTYSYSGNYPTAKTGSCHAVVHLTSGQQVWLKCHYRSHFDSQLTTFSGYLLSVDEEE